MWNGCRVCVAIHTSVRGCKDEMFDAIISGGVHERYALLLFDLCGLQGCCHGEDAVERLLALEDGRTVVEVALQDADIRLFGECLSSRRGGFPREGDDVDRWCGW